MAVPLFYYRSEVNIMQVQLSADERLDVVNERLRLIQKKNGLTFGTTLTCSRRSCVPSRVRAARSWVRGRA